MTGSPDYRVAAAKPSPPDEIDERWRAHAENATIGGVYSADEARQELRKVSREFLKAVDALKNATALALVHAVRATAGSGKTEINIEVLAHWLRANPGRTCLYVVPRIDDLGEKIVTLFAEHGIDARLYRGRDRDDPEQPGEHDPEQPGEQMCQDLERVSIAVTCGLNVQKTCCRNGDQICPFFSSCGYQRQFRDPAPQVWVAAANLLFYEQKMIAPPSIVVIDELFWRAGLRRFEDRKTGVAKPLPLGAISGGGRLSALRRKLNRALCAQGDRVEGLGVIGQQIGVERGSLERALTVEECIVARKLEYRYLPRPEMYPDMPQHRLKRIDKKSVERSRRIIAVWQEAIALLSSDQQVSGRLCLTLDDDGLAAVCVNTIAQIHPQWQAPTLIMDATLPGVEILRAYFPTAKIVGDIFVPAPHARVRQIVDAPTTAKKLIGVGKLTKALRKAVERNCRRVLHYILKRYVDVGRAKTLVIAQQKVANWLRNQHLPDNIHVVHFNKQSGLDQFRDVRLLIVVGRTAPPPATIEPEAGALTGVAAPTVLRPPQYHRRVLIAPAQWWWQTIPRELEPGVWINSNCHPDPLVEALRWQSCEAGVLQAIGRPRAIHRTAANPVDIDILADVWLPIRLDAVERWQEPNRFAVMLATEGIMVSSSTDMVKARPLWASSRSAERAVQEAGGSRQFPIKDSKRDLAGTFSPLRYRPPGNGQHWRRAWYDPAVLPNPRGWLERKLGRQIMVRE